MTQNSHAPASRGRAGFVGTLRQIRHPRALRIRPVGWDPGSSDAAMLDAQIERLKEIIVGGPPVAQALDPTLVKTMVTAFWKMEGQVARMPESNERASFEVRLRQIARTLKSQDVQVYDYRDKPLDPNEIWDDLIGDVSDKPNAIIVDMREPRIVYRGQMIQRGTPVVKDQASSGEPS